MVYDHLGRRAALSESLGTGSSLKKDVQFYIYDGDDLVYRQFTGTAITPLDSSDVTSDNGVLYLNGPTGPIMEFDRFGAYRTLLFDPQGSSVSSTQGLSYYGGNITGTTWYPVFYDSYGSQVWIPANGSSVSKLNRATSQPFQYKGQYGYYTDGATGLNYCLNRYYDPLTGRWLSRDPSGLDGGVNVYAYVNGDPVLGADPSGLDSMLILIGQPHAEERLPLHSCWDGELAKQLAAYAAIRGIHAYIANEPTEAQLAKLLPQFDYISAIGHGQVGDTRNTKRHELGVTMRRISAVNDAVTDVFTATMLYNASLRRGKPFKGVFLEACGQCRTISQREHWLKGALKVRGYEGLTDTFGALIGVDIGDGSAHPRLWTLKNVRTRGQRASQKSGY